MSDQDRRALLLSLIAHWAKHYPHDESDDNQPPWWLSPQKINPIVASFDAPINADNDPIAGHVQNALFLLCCVPKVMQI